MSWACQLMTCVIIYRHSARVLPCSVTKLTIDEGAKACSTQLTNVPFTGAIAAGAAAAVATATEVMLFVQAGDIFCAYVVVLPILWQRSFLIKTTK